MRLTFCAAALVSVGPVQALGAVLARRAGTLVNVDLTHRAGEAWWDTQTQEGRGQTKVATRASGPQGAQRVTSGLLKGPKGLRPRPSRGPCLDWTWTRVREEKLPSELWFMTNKDDFFSAMTLRDGWLVDCCALGSGICALRLGSGICLTKHLKLVCVCVCRY